MAYTMYLDGVPLPITPSKLDIRIGNQNKTVTLINEGEINILKSPGLIDVSFDALIPQTPYPFAIYPDGFKDVEHFLSKFEELKAEKTPFQFILSRVTPSGKLLFDTNIKVALEEWRIIEDAREGLDLTVSIKLKQYKAYGTKLVNVTTSTSASSPPIASVTEPRDDSSAPKPKSYTVKAGDTLWIIAKKTLGDGSRYPEIHNLNRDKIPNPNVIRVGQVLTLPN